VLPSKRQRKRKARELSGRQPAMQKLNKERKRNLSMATYNEENKEWPPPFVSIFKSMRKVLLEFSGEEEVFLDEEALAIRVNFTRKFIVLGKVRPWQTIFLFFLCQLYIRKTTSQVL